MQIFLLILFLFLVGCMLGWVIEVFFRRFVSAKKWVNPGFMKGPWLPLYGFGLVLMFALCALLLSTLPSSLHFYNPLGGLFGLEEQHGPSWADIIPILTMGIGMILLEFIAGLIFIKGFKVKLWDYTNMKGNIMGIICPVFSVIWMLVAVIFYYLVNPFLYDFSVRAYAYMFGENGVGAHFGFIFSIGILYGVMIYDFVVSVGLFSTLSRISRETGILERYEDLKERMVETLSEAKKLFIKEKPKKKKEPSILKEKIAEAIYIDPELEKHKPDNYDASGRPIKTEEE